MAADWFKQFPPVTFFGKTRLADLETAAGETAQADALLREVWIDTNFAPADEQAFLQHYGDKIRPSTTPSGSTGCYGMDVTRMRGGCWRASAWCSAPSARRGLRC